MSIAVKGDPITDLHESLAADDKAMKTVVIVFTVLD
jgi:Mn-containing catalase